LLIRIPPDQDMFLIKICKIKSMNKLSVGGGLNYPPPNTLIAYFIA